MSDRVVHAPAQMLHEGLRERFIIIKRHRFVQNRDVAGLSDISADSCDEPERVIVKSAADIRVALLGEGLVLVIRVAVRELSGSNIDDPLSGALRYKVNETEQILTGISKAHASSDTGLIIGGAAGHIECDHALILIPDVDHSVHFRTGTGDMEFAEQFTPVAAKRLISRDDRAAIMIFADHRMRFGLIDDSVRLPFLFYGIFYIGQLEDYTGAFARSEFDIEFKDCAGRPSACYSILAGTTLDHFGEGGASVIAYERAPVGIKAADRTVYGEDSIHVSALSVLCAMINSGVIEFAVIVDRSLGGFLKTADLVTEIGLYFDFAGRKISLEILLVIVGIPEAPFNIRKYFEILFLTGFVLNI